MAAQGAPNDELEDYNGEEQILPRTILPEDPPPVYDHYWTMQDPQYTAMDGVAQTFIHMYNLVEKFEAEDPVDRSAIVCLLEAMLKLRADDDTRVLLCESLEELDEEGIDKGVTIRLVELMREVVMRGDEDVCLRLAELYALGFRVAKDEEVACQVYRLGWTSNAFEKKAKYSIGKAYVQYMMSLGRWRASKAVLEDMVDWDPTQNMSGYGYGHIYGIVVWAVQVLVDMLLTGTESVLVEHDKARRLAEFWTGVMKDLQKEGEDWEVEHLKLFAYLGKIYEEGLGGSRNLDRAFESYKHALTNGNNDVIPGVIRVMQALDMDLSGLTEFELAYWARH